MKKQLRAPPIRSGRIKLPVVVQHVIDNHYSQISALAWRGYQHHGRGAIAITADGFVGYFTAQELHMLVGASGQSMQAAIATYSPESTLVICILTLDTPYGLILRRDTRTPLASARRISQVSYPLIPTA